jgi:Ser/Thr protein kinase RdoA (MazF antagonist)
MSVTPFDRERFAPAELARVLSFYDLGPIESAKEYPRGSRKSPKLILRTENGAFLLKRRADFRGDPFKVAFAHALIEHLRDRKFPVPALIGTRGGENSILTVEGRTYELFQFVEAEKYDESLEATTDAGRALAGFHDAVADFRGDWTPPESSFHDSPHVRNCLNAIPSTTAGHDSVIGHEAELLCATQNLYERYDAAAEEVGRCGWSRWPNSIIHGDWHPGNMLFRNGHVVAVLDLDSARYQPRVVDLANGMLQFSIMRGRKEPVGWPDFFDLTRMRRFFEGYLQVRSMPADQRRALPDLMVESLIAEAVLPIAMTGSFGRMPGFGVLQMVHRKVRWLCANRDALLGWLLG